MSGTDPDNPLVTDPVSDGGPDSPIAEMAAAELDDTRDRVELRQRYYGLLQELRTILPGVQVLVAFLLTVPFASRFGDLDDAGRAIFAVAMLSSVLSVVCMLTPTVFHRVAPHTVRSRRLVWSIRVVVVGMALLAVALVSVLLAVSRFVFGTAVGIVMSTVVAVVLVALWLVLPLRYRS